MSDENDTHSEGSPISYQWHGVETLLSHSCIGEPLAQIGHKLFVQNDQTNYLGPSQSGVFYDSPCSSSCSHSVSEKSALKVE